MKDPVSLITVMEQETLKTVRSKYGEFEVDVPQDRQSSFEPQVLPKRQKDISSIDDKIIAMYAKGMTTRQISETIEDIYGFEAFPKTEQQRCIVHMVRNTLKYVANKDMKSFAKDLKTIYTAASEEAARKQLETVDKEMVWAISECHEPLA